MTSPDPLAPGWRTLAPPRGQAPDRVSAAFARLALTHALVMGADAMVTVALAGSLFFSISPTAARDKVALSLLFTMLPFGIVAPLLGPAIDRSRVGRRTMLVAAAAGRCVAALLMARWIHGLLLFPAALALLVLSKTHAVVRAALVPSAVRSQSQLVEANGKLAMVAAIMGVAVAGPAAGILKLAGGAWVLRVAALIYACGAISGFRLHPAPPPPRGGHAATAEALLLDRGVTLAATAMAVLRGIVGFLTFAVAFDFRREHAPSWWYGVVIGASLVGSFAGAFLGPRIRARVPEERLLAGAVVLVSVTALVAGWNNSRVAMALLALVVGTAAGAGRLAFDAIVQRDSEEGARGRSFARFEALFQLAWVGAALIPVVVVIPNAVACFVLGIGTGLTAMFYVTGRRAARRLAGAGPAQVGRPGADGAAVGPTRGRQG